MKHCDDTSRGCADSGGYACHCYCDLCRAAQGDPDASRIIALESRAAELEAALRALCAHTYKCYRSGCNERATRFSASRGFKVCDAHGPDEIDMQYARQLRAALLLLAKGG